MKSNPTATEITEEFHKIGGAFVTITKALLPNHPKIWGKQAEISLKGNTPIPTNLSIQNLSAILANPTLLQSLGWEVFLNTNEGELYQVNSLEYFPFNPCKAACKPEEVYEGCETTAARANKADRALIEYRDTENTEEYQIRDLITDLLHLAHRQGFDPENTVRFALETFNEEADPS
jgi:hypothetical protein